MRKATLSVIIPNYNKMSYLEQCINSILCQTFQPIEVIIVDDCSTDGSQQLIQKLAEKDSKIIPIYLQKNQGVSHARNYGIKKSQGEYITCLDSDDFYINERKLEVEMQVLLTNNAEGIAYSRYVPVEENGERTDSSKSKMKFLEGKCFKNYLNGNFSFDSIARDYCIKKSSILEIGGYDEKHSLYEDLELLIKLTKKYELIYTGQEGTAYRQLGSGLSSQNMKKHWKARNEIFYGNLELLSFKEKIAYILKWEAMKIVDRAIFYFIQVAKKGKTLCMKLMCR